MVNVTIRRTPDTCVLAQRRAVIPKGKVATGLGVLVATVLGMSVIVSPVYAAGPPVWPPSNPSVLNVHSTRVLIRMTLLIEELATKWKAEYAPTTCNGQVPGPVPPGKAPENDWTTTNEAEIHERTSTQIVYIGATDPGAQIGATVLRHLKPGTCYYARFLAENSDSKLNAKGETEPTTTLIPFKTLPVETPEIPQAGELETAQVNFLLENPTDNSVEATAKIETNGSDTEYSFEYSLPEAGHAPSSTASSWKQFSTNATGHITSAEDFARAKAELSGLSPETTYYIRIKLSNEKGTVFQTKYNWGADESEFFVTGTAKPRPAAVGASNMTGLSAHLSGYVAPSGSRTVWQFEYAQSESLPPDSSSLWKPVAGPGAAGEITQEQAAATPYVAGVSLGVDLGGLTPSSSYFVRLTAENAAGSVSEARQFETEGVPVASTFNIRQLVGESLSLQGAVNPKSVPTSAEQSIMLSGATGGTFALKFKSHETDPIAYNASSEAVEHTLNEALESLAGRPQAAVEGVAGGPYTVIFGGSAAGSAQPLLEANESGLIPIAPASSVTITATQQGGEVNEADYWFQYVSDKTFAEHGWENPSETVPVEAKPAMVTETVNAPVSGLVGGEGYHFRIVANSSLPGSSLIVGNEQELTAPTAPVAATGGESCPNEALRTGLSAHLPDCRAYEQLTPLEKGGAQEPFHYRGGIESAVLVGEDGDHAVLEAPEVNYGSSVVSGQSPYLFSRQGNEWAMTAGADQPRSGLDSFTPEVYNADLTEVAVESAYSPSQLSESPEVEYKIGPIGGPYATVASVPRSYVVEASGTNSGQAEGAGWVAGTGDFSKLVLQTRDHSLLGGGSSTGTKSGSDLYEYTPQGALTQLNVTEDEGETVPIGSCGAHIVRGKEDPESSHAASSPNSISEDGKRVFFEAVPGNNCSAPSHLFIRVDGQTTIDVGRYTFVAANKQGTRVLLKDESTGQLAGYNVTSGQFEAQPSSEIAEDQELETLEIPVRIEPNENNTFARPRYVYWQTKPVGSEARIYLRQGQVYRYDDAEQVVECVSCASSFDPEATANVYLDGIQGLPLVNGGLPAYTSVSGNGDFAFFTTIAPLVREDVDGELPVEKQNTSSETTGEYLDAVGDASPSTDVYEWRAAGIDGCGLVQGCVALITDGRGGYLNLLLGTADEGRDVFFYTRSMLWPGDKNPEGSIAEGNVYDARMDGGMAPPPAGVTECEGDECSRPPSALVDSTPSSFTFAGPGNPPLSSQPATKSKSKPKAKEKKRGKRKRKRAKVTRGKHVPARKRKPQAKKSARAGQGGVAR